MKAKFDSSVEEMKASPEEMTAKVKARQEEMKIVREFWLSKLDVYQEKNRGCREVVWRGTTCNIHACTYYSQSQFSDILRGDPKGDFKGGWKPIWGPAY